MTGDAAPPTRAWPFNGYAPGDYHCRCARCEQMFIGDKRAVSCLPCAEKVEAAVKVSASADVFTDLEAVIWVAIQARAQKTVGDELGDVHFKANGARLDQVAALAKEALMNRWRPIETAPATEDARADLWIHHPDHTDGYRISGARWLGGEWCTADRKQICGQGRDAEGRWNIRPTHWRPEPPPPLERVS